jgi:hypothetical protein
MGDWWPVQCNWGARYLLFICSIFIFVIYRFVVSKLFGSAHVTYEHYWIVFDEYYVWPFYFA